jgi:hypothetical protein
MTPSSLSTIVTVRPMPGSGAGSVEIGVGVVLTSHVIDPQFSGEFVSVGSRSVLRRLGGNRTLRVRPTHQNVI